MRPHYRIYGEYPCLHLDIVEGEKVTRHDEAFPQALIAEAHRHWDVYLCSLRDPWERRHLSIPLIIEGDAAK